MDKPSCNFDVVMKNISHLKLYNIKEAEIVITRYDEDLQWTEDFAHLCTVYNKGPTLSNDGGFAKVIEVPNYGINEEVLLRHIIENYDNLATMTFFCQGKILDRPDQPLYPILYYLQNPKSTDIRGFFYKSYDIPTWKYSGRASDASCLALEGRTLAQFRTDIIGIPYKRWGELWAAGDWLSVGSALIRSKPREYYIWIYNQCRLDRGIIVEEVSFLERSFHSIFTRPLDPEFQNTKGFTHSIN
jgi:hypothetical protein